MRVRLDFISSSLIDLLAVLNEMRKRIHAIKVTCRTTELRLVWWHLITSSICNSNFVCLLVKRTPSVQDWYVWILPELERFAHLYFSQVAGSLSCFASGGQDDY